MFAATNGLPTPVLWLLAVLIPACAALFIYFDFLADNKVRQKWLPAILILPLVIGVTMFGIGYNAGFTGRDDRVHQATQSTRTDIAAEAREIERRAAALSRFANTDFGPQDKTTLAVELLTLENLARQLAERSQ